MEAFHAKGLRERAPFILIDGLLPSQSVILALALDRLLPCSFRVFRG